MNSDLIQHRDDDAYSRAQLITIRLYLLRVYTLISFLRKQVVASKSIS